MNYDIWRELFETHCITFGLCDHLNGTSFFTPATEKTWKERDGLVKMWLYGSITDSLVATILKPKSTSRDLWLSIEELFRDNKENRALQLENELCTITIGDLSVQDYCSKLKHLSDLLSNVDSPISDRALVMHCLNRLTDKFDGIHNIIRHRSPFPSFHTARSMLLAEKDRINKQIRPAVTHTHTPSSPTVMYTAEKPPQPPSHQPYHNNRGNNKNRGARGGGRGNRGRGRHNNGNSGYGYPPPWYHGPPQPWSPPYYNGGFHHSHMTPPSPHPFHSYGPPNSSYEPHVSNSSYGQNVSNYGPSITSRPNSILGPPPTRPRHEAHLAHSVSSTSHYTGPITTALAHAFNTMTLQDPADASLYMDTGATNHMTAQQGFSNQEHNCPM